MKTYLAVVIGAAFWLLFELNKARALEEFQMKKFLKLNYISFLMNIMIGSSLICFKEYINQFIEIKDSMAFFYGFAGQAILKKITGIFSKESKTTIGIN